MTDTKYTLILLVRDTPGVLVRVAQVFARRACNISSVHVTPHKDGVWSDMTIGVSNIVQMDQIIHQLEKLVDIKSVRVSENDS